MSHPPLWLPQPPALSAAAQSCLTEAGSLTERLQGTGRRFAASPCACCGKAPTSVWKTRRHSSAWPPERRCKRARWL
ncbi:hypothetical protein JOS77_04080 [Chromobacterium haemolyticum]|nr:hypothetical protein JOS77_04080 [Chromobacterium haemolyticum]